MIRPRSHLSPIARPGQSWENRGETIRLDMNEKVPDIGISLFAEVISQLRPWMLSAYPEVNPLYRQLAAFLNREVENVVLTSGSDAGIRQTIETFCDPGDELLITYPTYGMYEVYAQIFNLRCSRVCYREDFSIDFDEIIEQLNGNIKLIALANPSGVLGSLLAKDGLERVLVRASEVGTVVLLDEAYHEYADTGWADRIDEFDNLVIARTFSKAAGLAGLRAGYLVCNRHVRNWIYRTKPVVEMNAVAILAAQHVLANPEVITRGVAETKAGAAYLAAALADLGFPVHQGHANFVLVEFGAQRDAVLREFSERGISVRDYGGDEFWNRYTRITTGPRSVMEHVVDAVGSVVSAERPAGSAA
ncbi:MAG: hypothetical protein JWP08_3878 [Bryobacterales bacterium]|nr:hypothetical protein [Bryobacterales bacterium]